MERSRPIKRKAGTRAENRRLLLVCEGEKTEKLYFEGIRRAMRLSTADVHVVGAGAEPLRVVREAKELAADYDDTWCVFDVEAPLPHPRLGEALALALKAGLRCAISNPCFELWLVLHFKEHTAYIENRAIQSLLRDCGCGYERTDKGIDFAQLWPKRSDAIQRAVSLDIRQRANYPREQDRNPWTSVHELVEAMIRMGEARL